MAAHTNPADAQWRPDEVWEPVRQGQSSATDVYAAQRAHCPVSRTMKKEGFSVWHAFRADDVAAVLADTETFSSAVPKFGQPLIPIETDPPQHTGYRRLLSKMMSPRRLVGYEAAARAAIVEALDPIVAAGEGDLVPLTYQLPIRTFCLMMGEEDVGFDALDQARRRGSPPPDETGADAAAARQALMAPLREFCRRRLRACRDDPGEDLASDIAYAEIDGRPLSEDEAVSILSLIYIAGHGTTTTGMQGAVMQLARHADVQLKLRQNPRLLPPAIEECLRLETPLHTLPRYCKRDTQLRGREISAGDQVYPVYAAANLDPDAFAEPATFDINRRPNHFAFGRGVHMCAGAPLARMQIRVLIEELLARSTGFELLAPPRRKRWPNNGCDWLGVRFHV